MRRPEFQSLSGFLMRCDAEVGRAALDDLEFQSLSGFLMRCDLIVSLLGTVSRAVSIPIGFSDAL